MCADLKIWRVLAAASILLWVTLPGCRARPLLTQQDIDSGTLDPRETVAGKTLLGKTEETESAETLAASPVDRHVEGYRSTTEPKSDEDLSPETVGTLLDVYETAQTIHTLANGGEGFQLGAKLEQGGSSGTQAAVRGIRGVVAYKQGEFGEAIDRFTEAIDADPQNGRLWSARAEAFYALGQHQYALADCRQALGLDAQNPDAWYLQGEIYQLAGDWETALRSFDEAQRLRKNHADTSIRRSEVLSLLGRHTEARAAAERAVQLRPEDPATRTALGFVFAEAGDVSAAMQTFTAVLREHPDHARAYFGRGSLALLEGELESASRDLDRAVELAPEFGNARHRRAMLLVRQGNWDAALVECRTAAEDPLVEPYVFNTLGVIHLNQQHPELAVAAYSELLKSVPDDATALSNRANALTQLGQFDAAIADAQAALKLDPQLGDAHNHLANAQTLAGHVDEALAAYEQALIVSPGHPHYRVNRGQALLKAGEYQKAVRDFAAVIEQTDPSPVVAVAYWRRAEAAEALGQSSIAELDRQHAREIDPDVENLSPLVTR